MERAAVFLNVVARLDDEAEGEDDAVGGARAAEAQASIVHVSLFFAELYEKVSFLLAFFFFPNTRESETLVGARKCGPERLSLGVCVKGEASKPFRTCMLSLG